MLQIVISKRFKKNLNNFLKKHPELKLVFENKLAILQNDSGDSRLKLHKLSGNLKNFLAISISYEHRLVFYIENNFIFLIALGTHDEVY